MVPEIWSVTDRIFFVLHHFLPSHPTKACDGRNFLFFTLGYFLPFYPSNSWRNQNLEKVKKTPTDIIILHMCTKNYDQIMYSS